MCVGGGFSSGSFPPCWGAEGLAGTRRFPQPGEETARHIAPARNFEDPLPLAEETGLFRLHDFSLQKLQALRDFHHYLKRQEQTSVEENDIK